MAYLPVRVTAVDGGSLGALINCEVGRDFVPQSPVLIVERKTPMKWVALLEYK